MALNGADPERRRHRQRRALGAYLRTEVVPFSSFYADRLRRAGLADGRLETLDQLRRVPLTTLEDLGDGTEAVMRPRADTLLRSGPLKMRWGAAVAKVTGRAGIIERTLVDPAYKPVQWHLHDGVPIGSSQEDLERLAELGRRWLDLAGVSASDTMVSLLDAGPSVAFWQLTGGARRAGISMLSLGAGADPDLVASLHPDVVVGTAAQIEHVLADGDWVGREPTTVIVVSGRTPLDDDAHRRLDELAGPGAVVEAIEAPGARAVWSACRGGRAVHTSPDVEVIEVVGDDGPVRRGQAGRVVWTGIGWRGTVLVRVDTGVRAVMDETRCTVCDRDTPRLAVQAPEPEPEPRPDWMLDLDDHDEVLEWFVIDPAKPAVAVCLSDGRRRNRVLAELEDLGVTAAAVVEILPKREFAQMLSELTTAAADGDD